MIDNFVTTDFVTAITGGMQVTQKERKLLALLRGRKDFANCVFLPRTADEKIANCAFFSRITDEKMANCVFFPRIAEEKTTYL